MLAESGTNAAAPIAPWPHAHTAEGLRKTPQLLPVPHLHNTFRYMGLSGQSGCHREGTVVPPPLLLMQYLGLYQCLLREREKLEDLPKAKRAST